MAAISQRSMLEAEAILSRIGQNEEPIVPVDIDLAKDDLAQDNQYSESLDTLRLERVSRVEKRAPNMFRTNIPSGLE